MIASLLTIVLFAQLQQGPELSIDSADALVRRMQAAVEAGRGPAERSMWAPRVTPDSNDRTALLAVATLDRFLYRDADAERAYRAIVRDQASPAAFAYAVLGLGALRAQQARLAEAEPLLRDAARLLSRGRHSAGEAQALGTLAIVVSRTVSLDSAIATYAAALKRVPDGDGWLREWIACNALVARVRKADPEVARLARPTAEAAKRAGNPRAATACLAALAQDYERRTLIDSAMATFNEVAELQRATRNLSALAITRQWQGFVLYSLKNDFAAARAALAEALALGEQTGSVAAAAWASLDLAMLALTVGDLSSSGVYARRATALFASTGDRWGLLHARMYEGDVALLNRALGAARSAYEQVARDAGTVFPTLGVHARGRLAFVALFEGDVVDAKLATDAALRLSRTLEMPEWRQEDAYARALIALAEGRLAEAESHLHSLERILPPASLAERADVSTRLAEVYARGGDMVRAEAELTSAGALIDRWRATLSQRELQAAVVQTRNLDWDRDLGFATVVHLIAERGERAAAFRLSEQRRARVLLEHLAERQALATHVAAAAPATTVLPDAQVRRVLPESTAVLVFLTGRGGEPTTVFVLTRDQLRTASADAVDDHLLELDRFAGLVATGDDPVDLSQRLGNAFLRSALALVPASVRRLVIVPDGPLHRVPFDALRSGTAHGPMLIDRFAISLAPSASVAASWWANAPRAPLPRLLAFGDPAGVRLATNTVDSIPPRLPASASEVRRIERYARLADVFTGADAREARLRHAAMAEVGVLHFATHAMVDEWSLLRSALFLAPGDGDDGRVGVDELVGMHVNANLVVLAACQSGGGAVLAGEGLQGLTSPFLEAGAASVVSTLWQIGDRSAAPFIDLLYRELSNGASVGDALHRAKLAARAQRMSPGIWAAFTLTGDERVRTGLRPARLELRASVLNAAVAVCVLGYLVSFTIRRRKADRR